MDAAIHGLRGTFYPSVTLQVWTYTQDLKTFTSARLGSVQFNSTQILMAREPLLPQAKFS